VTPKPSSDVGRLRAAAQALEPEARPTDHRRALEFAATALRESHALNRELYWISDFQSAGFTGGDDAAIARAMQETKTRVYVVPMTPRGRSNVGLTDVALAPSEGDVAVSVTSRSFAAPAGDRAVEVEDVGDNQRSVRGFLNVPEDGDATALLPLNSCPSRAASRTCPTTCCRSTTSASSPRVARARCGSCCARTARPRRLLLALQAGSPASGLSVHAVDAVALPGATADADAIVLNDLERLGSTELQAVLDFHRAGGGLFIVLGSRADPGFWNGSLLHELGAGDWVRSSPPARAARGGCSRRPRDIPRSRASPRGRASRSRARGSRRCARSAPRPARARCSSSIARIRRSSS
jgi:hypothetical protein